MSETYNYKDAGKVYKNVETGDIGFITGIKETYYVRQYEFAYCNIETGRSRTIWVDMTKLVPATEDEWRTHIQKINEKGIERKKLKQKKMEAANA